MLKRELQRQARNVRTSRLMTGQQKDPNARKKRLAKYGGGEQRAMRNKARSIRVSNVKYGKAEGKPRKFGDVPGSPRNIRKTAQNIREWNARG